MNTLVSHPFLHYRFKSLIPGLCSFGISGILVLENPMIARLLDGSPVGDQMVAAQDPVMGAILGGILLVF
jgi:hypothetical protein